MATTELPRIEAQLRASAERYAAQAEAAELERITRDELIAQAVDELDVPHRTVARWAGCSQTTIMRVVARRPYHH